MSRILIVDDEPGIRDVLADVMRDERHEPVIAEDGVRALETLESTHIDLILLDIWLPGIGGMEVLERVRRDWPEIEVVVISGHGTIDMAVQALKLGAREFLEKPLSLDRTTTVVRNALQLEDLKRQNRALRSERSEDELITNSPTMQGVRRLVAQAGGSDARILIIGESGSGKELVAREIHRRSARASGPFVEVNCAAIPEALIESELFGHEKGAFTSAVSHRRGKFELADSGTLFLDEIADMALPTQAKILRVIQELSFERVGGERSINVDVRLVAATNKDIMEEIGSGRFREDLFFRLNVIPIEVPPLRNRCEDIEPLLANFLAKFGGERTVQDEAMALLHAYRWPGNVRELKNFAERVTIMAGEGEITPETVAAYLMADAHSASSDAMTPFDRMPLRDARDSFEQQVITRRLQANDHNVTRTAASLGMTPNSLHNRMAKHSIARQRRSSLDTPGRRPSE